MDMNKPPIEQSFFEFPSILKNIEDKIGNMSEIKDELVKAQEQMQETLRKFYEEKIETLKKQDDLFSRIGLLLLGFNKNIGIGFINGYQKIRQQRLKEIENEFRNRQLLEELKV